MGINRCTDSTRGNVGLGQPDAATFSERSRSARFLVMVAAVAIVALFALFWQQSNPLQPAFAGAGDATGPVTITGTAEVGQTLTADTSAVADTDGITNVSYTYAWYSGGAVVDGETATTYGVLARDMMNSIYVVVTFQDDASNEERLQSAAVGPIPTVLNNEVTGEITITVNGSIEVGKTLTVDTAAVVDTDGITNVSYTYEWYSGGAVVDGETESTYRVLARDMMNSIYVVVTFEDDLGHSERLQSAAVGPVPTVLNNEVTGRIDVFPPNQAFEVHARFFGREDISDGDGLPGTDEYRWQWLRNGQPIDGAIDREIYVVTADDVGSRISLRLQFNDRLGFEEEFVNNPSDPVPNGPVIRATNGYNFDDNDATVETLTVDLSRLNYPGVPENRSYTYLWEHVGAEGDVTDTFSIPQTYGDGMGGQIDRGADHDSGATFTLTSGDDGKYIQVEVTINDASDNDRQWRRKFANRATPEITMRPPVEAPANVAANVRSGGGSVTLNWGLTSFGGARPTSFQYRYKPTVLLSGSPFTDTDWIALTGGAARSVTVESGLINNAAYTFEVRSSNATAMSDPETVEATYRHKTRACP